MNEQKIREVLNTLHCRGCDSYGCDFQSRIDEAVKQLMDLFDEESDELAEYE